MWIRNDAIIARRIPREDGVELKGGLNDNGGKDDDAAEVEKSTYDKELAEKQRRAKLLQVEAVADEAEFKSENFKTELKNLKKNANRGDAGLAAQNLGGATGNLAMGTGAIWLGAMLTAVFPPLGVPLLIIGVGTAGKGVFQTGVGVNEGAKYFAGERAARKFDREGSGERPSSINSRVKALGDGVNLGVRAAGDAYNWVTDRNAPDDSGVKAILERPEGDPAGDYLKAAEKLGKSKKFKKLNDILNGKGDFFIDNKIDPEEREVLRKGILEVVEGKTSDKDVDDLADVAELLENRASRKPNKKRTNKYYKAVADAINNLNGSEKYQDYVQKKEVFDREADAEDLEVIEGYQKAVKEYDSRRVKVAYQRDGDTAPDLDDAQKGERSFKNDVEIFKQELVTPSAEMKAFLQSEPYAADIIKQASVDIKDVTSIVDSKELKEAYGLKDAAAKGDEAAGVKFNDGLKAERDKVKTRATDPDPSSDVAKAKAGRSVNRRHSFSPEPTPPNKGQKVSRSYFMV